MNVSHPTSPFRIRGVVEGFYGVFYTTQERNDLIRFLGTHNFTHYIYAPKNDRQHRARWREPYPAYMMDQFEHTIAVAYAAGVAFAYSLGPGESICYSSDDDFDAITAKFKAFYERGVCNFHLFLDDIAPTFRYPADEVHYANYAEAHADLCNRLYIWLQTLDPGIALGMCPTFYHGTPPFDSYVETLGNQLDPAIDVFYTGPEICSPTITRDDAHAFAQVVRRPPIIWDNYPVNDLAMQPELHIGPLAGRDSTLHTAVKGFVSNLMIQAEASKIPLVTIAAYLRDPQNYDPDDAWEHAMSTVAGQVCARELHYLAENALSSCLGKTEAPLDRLANEALEMIRQGVPVKNNGAVDMFLDYCTKLDEACYHLKFRLNNVALRNNLLPWIELLEHRLWLGRWAHQTLAAYQSNVAFDGLLKRLQETLRDSRCHHKRIGGTTVERLAEYVIEQVT